MLKYTDEKLLELVPVSKSLSDFIRNLGLPTSGNYYAIFRHRLFTLGADTSHWVQKIEKHMAPNTNELSKNKKALKSKLIHSRGNKCESCLNTEWLSVPITLEVHHIDGNSSHNEESNLSLLCPNCHSQTSNWRGRNNKPYKKFFCSCGTEICSTSSLCRSCSAKQREVLSKIQITKEELEKLLEEMPMTEIGNLFGVSGTAIKKRAKKLGIDLKPMRGHWQKKNASLV